MKIIIKLDPADLRAIGSVVIAAVLALHPASRTAMQELQQAVAAQFATWSPLVAKTEIRAGNIKSGEVRPGEVR